MRQPPRAAAAAANGRKREGWARRMSKTRRQNGEGEPAEDKKRQDKLREENQKDKL